MLDRSKKYLYDIKEAATLVKQFTTGKSFSEYSADPMLRSATERQLMIIGEALNKIGKNDPETLEKIGNHKKIIGFRNIIVHGYDIIDDETVWGVIQSSLDNLLQEVTSLLK